MSKFFVKSNQIVDNTINITGDSVNHIKNVLRLKINEEIQVCDIDTKINYICNIKEFLKDTIICDIIKQIENVTETNVYINIIQGLPKSDKMEWIIEKCTEIGVSEFTPLNMERCVVKIENEKAEEKKIFRWQSKAQSAAMQSGRNIIPKVRNIMDFNEIDCLIKDYDVVLVAYENENQNTIKNELKKINNKDAKIAVVIGPEGRNK